MFVLRNTFGPVTFDKFSQSICKAFSDLDNVMGLDADPVEFESAFWFDADIPADCLYKCTNSCSFFGVWPAYVLVMIDNSATRYLPVGS